MKLSSRNKRYKSNLVERLFHHGVDSKPSDQMRSVSIKISKQKQNRSLSKQQQNGRIDCKFIIKQYFRKFEKIKSEHSQKEEHSSQKRKSKKFQEILEKKLLSKTLKKKNQPKIQTSQLKQNRSEFCHLLPDNFAMEKMTGIFTKKITNIPINTQSIRIKQPFNQEPEQLHESHQLFQNDIDLFIYNVKCHLIPEMEFIYLVKNQANDYYNLKVISFPYISKKRVPIYFTLSIKGITLYIKKQPKEFQSLYTWLKERDQFNAIKGLFFFRKFRIWKTTKKWQKLLYQQRNIRISNKLQKTMFLLNPLYCNILLSHQKYCLQMESKLLLSGLRFVDFKLSTCTLEKFRNHQLQKKNEVAFQLHQFNKIMHQQSTQGIQTIVKEMKDQILSEIKIDDERFKHARDDDQKRLAIEKMGFPDNMSYGVRSKMRQEFTRFLKLAYLLDFIAIRSLGQLFLKNITFFLTYLNRLFNSTTMNPIIGTLQDDEIFKQRFQPLIKLFIDFNDSKKQLQCKIGKTTIGQLLQNPLNFDLREYAVVSQKEVIDDEKDQKKYRIPQNVEHNMVKIEPTIAQFVNATQQIFSEGLDTIQLIQRWGKNSYFFKYVKALEEWDQIIGQNWMSHEQNYLNPSNYIRESPKYRNFFTEIAYITEKQFDRIKGLVSELVEIFRVYYIHRNNEYELLNEKNLQGQQNLYLLMVCSFSKAIQLMQKMIIESVDLGIFQVNLCGLKKMICEQKEIKRKTERTLLGMFRSKGNFIKEWLKTSIKELSSLIIEVQDFVRAKESLQKIYGNIPTIRTNLESIQCIFKLLEEGQDQIFSLTDKQLFIQLLSLDSKISNVILDVENYMNKNVEKFRRSIKERGERLLKEASQLEAKIDDQKYSLATTHILQAVFELRDLLAKTQHILQSSKSFKSFQVVLNCNQFIDYSAVLDMHDKIQVKYSIWNGIQEIEEMEKQLMEIPFSKIDIKVLKERTKAWEIDVLKAEKLFNENQMLPKFKMYVQMYSQTIPVINAFRSPYLLQQHFVQIRSILQKEFGNNQSYTFEYFKSLNAHRFKKEMVEISIRALQQDSLKQQLVAIEQKWACMQLKVKNYRDTLGIYIIYDVDELLMELDESLASSSNILSSRYIKSLRTRAQKLYSDLLLLQEIIERWFECQKKWIYLENIFDAQDIKRQIPQETKDFQEAEKFLKNLMRKTYSHPRVSRLLTIKNLSQNLKKKYQILNVIQRSLEDYLQIKRRSFPRFYFLSNEQLLEILAQEVENIEQFISKCFEGISKFNYQKLLIHGFSSPQGETITLFIPVATRGPIEKWLGNLETAMFENVKKILRSGYFDYVNGIQKNKTDFIMLHKGQVVSLICKIMWCQNTEESIHQLKNKPNSILEWHDIQLVQLSQLTRLILEVATALERKILIALITSEVHNRDITASLSINEIEEVTDFHWQKQLRYYYQQGLSNQIMIQQIGTTLYYGYEYLGATSRLVITPLTQRYWMTINTALANYLGAAPGGPAGSGKTESTKDLAKGLGKLCIVFNCSDQITVKMMNKLLSGIVQQGAWTCLDEFNRIGKEVLSVIAQQILNIHLALCKKNQEKEVVEIDGQEMPLKRSCGIFITMNPGYAGRTQLPDNLKSLFRPVAMMIPDYAMIVQIMLFAQGFQNAPVLSKKMVHLYKLSSEQLSDQDHYDFGMRAVKSLLVMAGSLKQQERSLSQQIILIRAMRKANIPKLVKEDIRLFELLILDLFPQIEIPSIVNLLLREEIVLQLQKLNLQQQPQQINKAVQLLNTLEVRLGVMLVGPTGCAKTTTYKVLAKALSSLHSKKHKEYSRVNTVSLNPKCVSMGELYGQVDPYTQEWQDGLASSIIRKRNSIQVQQQGFDCATENWVVFDGPVDAIWIQNMNSVLDDNTTLCLANSQRIKLRKQLHLLFQVENLKVASPATVSRCGMVYLCEDNCEWIWVVRSWVNQVTAGIQNCHQMLGQSMMNLFEHILGSLFECKFRQPFATFRIQRAQNICLLMSRLISQTKFTQKLQDDMKKVNYIFLYAVVWAVGGSLDESEFDCFKAKLKQLIPIHFPRCQNLNDLYVNPENMSSFLTWESMVPEFVMNKQLSFFSMMVPTIDSVKYSHIIELCLNELKPCLITGSTGVGKSLLINTCLNKCNFQRVNIFFSAQTQAKRTQLQIQSKLTKKSKTVLGAKPNQFICTFIDDINMPAPENYGAQPCLELLRQLLDGGFWDRAKLFWKNVVDFTLIGAGGRPDGPRSPLPNRLLRRFLTICLPQSSLNQLKKIFDTLVKGFLAQNFSPNYMQFGESITQMVLSLYFNLKKSMLPTPDKFHYTFNLRDVAKIVDGITYGNPNSIKSLEGLWRLVGHECFRVFEDRLSTASDIDKFRKLIGTGFNPQCIFSSLNSPYYCQVSQQTLIKFLQLKQEEFNLQAIEKIEIVFFSQVVRKIVAVARVMSRQMGNALIVGVGGSGKSTIARLSGFLIQFPIFKIQPSKTYSLQSFHQDLQELIKQSLSNPCIFLMNDREIILEEFLEDINNLLNSGEIPNLFVQKEDLDQLWRLLRELALKRKIEQDNLWEIYVNSIKKNLHICLIMSPIGAFMRNRCRKFPSLVNCCNINWLFPWSEEVLTQVSKKYFGNFQVSQDQKNKLGKFWTKMSIEMGELCEQFYDQTKRRVYTTPKNFLDHIEMFKSLLNAKRKEMLQLQKQLIEGIEKMNSTKENVIDLQIQMRDFESKLEEQNQKNKILLQQLQIDSIEANQVQEVVQKETKIANEQAQEILFLTQEAQKYLAKALPALKEAEQALSKLNRNDITEIKGFTSPPMAVQMVMEAVCVLLGQKTDWNSAKSIMMDIGFLDRLKHYDKSKITEQMLKRLNVYTNKSDFEPAYVGSKAFACKSLCMWCKAMDNYAKIAKQVQPKRQTVAQLERQLKEKNNQLDKKKAELQGVRYRVRKLQVDYNKTLENKRNLEEDLVKTRLRLVRADLLINLIKDQELRWKEEIIFMKENLVKIIGDVFIAAAQINYFGPLTGIYRQKLFNKWKIRLVELQIPHSQKYSLLNTLESPIEVKDWVLEGLPNDNISIQNAILIKRASKWPMIIDPQGEAEKWLKNKYSKSGLIVLNFSQTHYLKKLQTAISSGFPVMIQDTKQMLDQVIEPLLKKQTIKGEDILKIKLGGVKIPYNQDFLLMLLTRINNPNYLPDIFIKLLVINFSITFEGLSDQLLIRVVKNQKPELEQKRDEVVVKVANCKKTLKQAQQRILKMLYQSKGMVLDDVELIDTLQSSKKNSAEIQTSLQSAIKIQQNIDKIRKRYIPVARRGCILYFTIEGLSNIDLMYHYSLMFFKKIFDKGLREALTHSNLEMRIKLLNDKISKNVFRQVTRGLFEEHKRIFSFLIATGIRREQKLISNEAWNLFLRGAGVPPANFKCKVNNIFGVSEQMWFFLHKCGDKLNQMERITYYLKDYQAEIHAFLKNEKLMRQKLPGDKHISNFGKLLLIKALRPEKLIKNIFSYIEIEIGTFYTDFKIETIKQLHQAADKYTPILFILSQGVDPTFQIMKFANQMKQTIKVISLGQGQGKKAQLLIQKAKKQGEWILLQNCHLAQTWMPGLQKEFKQLSQTSVNYNFRLILTSMPVSYFPVSVVQNCIKITTEPPRGIRANICKSMNILNDQLLDHPRKHQLIKLIYGLSFFHAIIQERKKFGSLGFNNPYQFGQSDLEISILMLKRFLNEKTEDIQWQGISFLTSQINYGGRVTDRQDRLCMNTLLKKYFNEELLDPNFKLSPNHQIPNFTSLELLKKFAEKIANVDHPSYFGMNENVMITLDKNQSQMFMKSILNFEPKNVSKKKVDKVITILQTLKSQVPAKLSINPLGQKQKNKHKQKTENIPSLTIVLMQQCEKYNYLIRAVEDSLDQLLHAIKGQVLMNQELQQMHYSISINVVPNYWKKIGYTSIKPLRSWFQDLKARVNFMSNWIYKEVPISFWISGFFFPQSFFTALLQTHARKHLLPIDSLAFKYKVMDCDKEKLSHNKEGVYIHGLFLEGGKWDSNHDTLVDQQSGILLQSMPPILVMVMKQFSYNEMYFRCPVYKTSVRVGILSTTGHSTNFICEIELNSKGERSDFWILRGTALICQEDI